VEKNEVLLENLKADVRSRDQMYSPKFHSGRMAPSMNIQSRV
jgi:hypothetical protein